MVWSSRRTEAAESLDAEKGLQTEAYELQESHDDTSEYETEEGDDEADTGHDEVDSQGATDGDSSDSDSDGDSDSDSDGDATPHAKCVWADDEDDYDDDDDDWVKKQMWNAERRDIAEREIKDLMGRINGVGPSPPFSVWWLMFVLAETKDRYEQSCAVGIYYGGDGRAPRRVGGVGSIFAGDAVRRLLMYSNPLRIELKRFLGEGWRYSFTR
jgi:hypothetical protein